MTKNNNTSAPIGFEDQLWRAADALRSNMDAAEYKHVVLGLIFLKYISDAFEEYHARLVTEVAQGADPEDPDEYRAINIFRRRYGYPPDKQEKATRTVLEQAEVLCRDWAVA
jgi:type I restriction enzyme M protein